MKRHAKHRWAANAANRFKLPMNDIGFGDQVVDADIFFHALIALQLRAYRRGVKDGEMRMARFYDQHSHVEVIKRGKTAEGKK